MIKETITYTDLEDQKITEDFYFNITIPEAVDLANTQEGGFAAFLKDIAAKKSGADVMAAFSQLIRLAYAQREGNQLIKDERATKIFMTSDAYSVLFMKLVTDAGFGAKFVTALFPKDLQEQVAKMQGGQSDETEPERTLDSYSAQELTLMPADEFQMLGRKNKHNLTPDYLIVNFNRGTN